MLRTVGTGLTVGSIGAVSGCLGQTGREPESSISRDIEEGQVEVDDSDEEPSSGSTLAGSASSDPREISRDRVRYRGRYDVNNHKPYINYTKDYIYIYNGGGYVINIEVFPGAVDDGEPTYNQNKSLGNYVGFPRSGDIRVSVVVAGQSLVISPELKNVEIWMGGLIGVSTVDCWLGDF